MPKHGFNGMGLIEQYHNYIVYLHKFGIGDELSVLNFLVKI